MAAAAVAVIVLLSGCAAPFPAAPTDVTGTGATLQGKVGSSAAGVATYFFEYGTTPSYGSRTPERGVQVAKGNAAEVQGVRIGGLNARTTYHFRMCASDPAGVGPNCSADQTFVTGAPEDAVFGEGAFGEGEGQGIIRFYARSDPGGASPTGAVSGTITRYSFPFGGPVTCLRVEGTHATIGIKDAVYTGYDIFYFVEDKPGGDTYGELDTGDQGAPCPAFRADLADNDALGPPGITVIDAP